MSNEESQAFSQQHARFSQPPKSLAGKLVSLILGAAFLVLAFMFSLVALAVVALGGIAIWGWLWWKTRAIRKQMREQPPMEASVDDGYIIEGEVVRETSSAMNSGRLLR